MAINWKKFLLGLNIVPKSGTTGNAQGDIEVDSATTKASYHNGTTTSSIVTEVHASQGTARLKNKDLEDSTTAIVDVSDTTKKIKFDAAGTTGTTTTVTSSQTTDRTLTLPDATDTLAALALAQTFSNKSFSDAPNLAEIATPTTPSSGFGKIYFKSDGFLYQLNDDGTETKVGAGSGNINYILNPDAESNTTGWATYADAAGTAPVDGTGGSPSSTFTRSTSSPLRGTASFLWTKSANNRQGEGVSYAFTIASADQAKVLAVNFDYTVASGTYVDGDMTVWLYDVTNSLVIQPTGSSILNGTTGLGLKQIAEFQTSSNSTSYRLIIHTSSTSASAYTVKFDNVFVGPTTTQIGAFISEWTTFTPTGSWSANSTYTGTWRRVGGNLEVCGKVALSGAPTSAFLSINIPFGLSIDSTKLILSANASRTNTLGTVSVNDNGGTPYFGFVQYKSATDVYMTALNASGTYAVPGTISETIPVTFANADEVTFQFTVPIVGWGTGQLLSSDTDTRVVAARAFIGTSQVISTATITQFQWATVEYDTHGGITTGASAKYTIPVSGYYQIDTKMNITSTVSFNGTTESVSVALYKNGTILSTLGNIIPPSSTPVISPNYTTTYPFNAGDTIDLRTTQDSGADCTMGNTITIKRISGPAQIAASESVNARITDTAGASISTSNTIYKYATTSFDSHNAYSASTGLYTVPVSGKYLVSAKLATASVNLSTSQQYYILIYKNGSLNTYGLNVTGTGAANVLGAGVTDMVSCIAGDTLAIWAISAVGTTANTTAGMNYFNITRVGN